MIKDERIVECISCGVKLREKQHYARQKDGILRGTQYVYVLSYYCSEKCMAADQM